MVLTAQVRTRRDMSCSSTACRQALAPRRVLQAEEDAPEVRGLGFVKVLHAGLEEVLRVVVEADARVVHLRACTSSWALIRLPCPRQRSAASVSQRRAEMARAGCMKRPAQRGTGA